MQLGKLTFKPIHDAPQLVAPPIRHELEKGNLRTDVYVAQIDPGLADTESFCKTYDIPLEISANCIIVEAKRGDKVWYAACLVLASDMIDVNGKVRRHLDARKISFAPRDRALQITAMEYGGVTPLGLPRELPILADSKIFTHAHVVIGGGMRGSKVLIATNILATLHTIEVMDIIK